MMARNFLAVAAAGGLAMGAVTGMAWQPRMKMAPLRPWQLSARPSDMRDFQPAEAWRDTVPVAYPVYAPPIPGPSVYQPLPRLALADDVVPQRPILPPERETAAREAAVRAAADEVTIADGDGPPPLDAALAAADETPED